MEGEMKEGRKIQFSVPTAGPIQLDPRQVEMIRRRRPTPATLFRVTDHPSPEEENPSFPLFVGENGVSKPNNTDAAIYKPPSLKAVQKMAQAHIKSPDTPSPGSSDNDEGSLIVPDAPSRSGRLTEKEKVEQEADHLSAEIPKNVENMDNEEK